MISICVNMKDTNLNTSSVDFASVYKQLTKNLELNNITEDHLKTKSIHF